MRWLLALAVALAACKGGDKNNDPHPPPPPPAPAPAPVYASAPASDAVLPLDKLAAPSHVVWIDRAGTLTYARVAKPWAATLPVRPLSVKDLETLAAKLEADHAEDRAKEPEVAEVSASLIASGRVSTAVGARSVRGGVPLVLADREVPATVVIGVLASIGGRLGVTLAGDRVAALRYVFERPRTENHDTTFWYEAHVATRSIEMLELMAGERTATAGDSVRDQLAPFVTDKGFDLLLDKAVSFQRLVDLLVAVDDLGVTTQLGLGAIPGPIDKRREQALAIRNAGGVERSATAILAFDRPEVTGGLAVKDARMLFVSISPRLLACYDKELATNTSARGTVHVQFTILADGRVVSMDATGVTPAVRSCITNLIKSLPMSRPTGGVAAEVRVALSFRPIER